MTRVSRFAKEIVALLVVTFVGIWLVGCQKTVSKQNSGKIHVVATTNFYGDVAHNVGGNKVSVISLIDGANIDPHDYEPTTGDAKDVSLAQVVIENGIGYDDWMSKLTVNAPKTHLIRVGNDLMNKTDGDNPHVWYNPKTIPKLARRLAKQYSKLQPDNRALFYRNAQKYVKALEPINTEMTAIKSHMQDLSTKEVYVSEPVFDYSLKALGFKVGNVEFENDTEKSVDPSPEVIKSMQSGIKHHRIAFFVTNSQVDNKTTDNFIAQCHREKIPVLSVTETQPDGMNYEQWMLSQYRRLGEIVK